MDCVLPARDASVVAAGVVAASAVVGGRAPVVRASRAATVIDNAAYFAAARDAMLQARRSILLLGWGFDSRTSLVPDGVNDGWPTRLGPFLAALAERRPEMTVRLLIWDMTLSMSAANGFYPQRAAREFRGTRVQFRLDRSVPVGACHHQKLLIVDGALAFCGGGDFMANRWDTAAHTDANTGRRLPSGAAYAPRHEVMLLVDGAAAMALDVLARERWCRATGERLEAAAAGALPWPAAIRAEAADVPVSISRTDHQGGTEPILEIERTYLAAIASAERLIYLENQYFTAAAIGDALAARLAERTGPEIVVVTSLAGSGVSDGLTMDAARDALIIRLRAADRCGRFHIYAALTGGGAPVKVHSKVMVVDDAVLSVGSANLNNRSLGYDTECDIAVKAADGVAGEAARRMIRSARDRLLSHFLGGSPRAIEEACAGRAALAAFLAKLDGGGQVRLQPLQPRPSGWVRRLAARWHLGDPFGPGDAWRPWRRDGSRHRCRARNAQGREHRQVV